MSLIMRNTIAEVTFEALTAGIEKAIEWREKDDHSVLVIKNDSEKTTDLTVKAGDGIQGTTNLKLEVPVGISLVKLESGRFKIVSYDKKRDGDEDKRGKIVVVSTGTPSVGIVSIV